jgi:hypothetical protein
MFPGRQHGDHDIGPLDDVADPGARFPARFFQLVDALRKKIVANDVMSRLDQIERHGQSHVAKSDETDRRHDALPARIYLRWPLST